MLRQQLKTLVHVSDLHIDSFKVEDRNGQWARYGLHRAPGLRRLFQGLAGHDDRAIRELVATIRNLQRNERAEVVFTGDLTAAAFNSQFAVGAQYLGDVLPGRLGFRVGLNLGYWNQFSVPGNHDHWSGGMMRQFGAPTDTTYAAFPERSYVRAPLELDGTHSLRVAGIHTDESDAPREGRVKAIGSFLTTLVELDRRLRRLPNQPGEIRVLLLHHSPGYPEESTISSKESNATLVIDGKSRRALIEFLLDHRIRVLLTGHIHAFGLNVLSLEGGFRAGRVLEARCGTTTQVVEPPAKWSSAAKINAFEPNTLLVHRIFRENSHLMWETEVWWLRLNSGFEPIPRGSRIDGRDVWKAFPLD